MQKKVVKCVIVLLLCLGLFASCEKEEDTITEPPSTLAYDAPTTGTHTNQEGKEVKNPQITIHLADNKDIVVELYPDKAPNTVNNFLALAQDGYFNNKLFHRVIEGFMVQTGGFERKNVQLSPGYSIKGEFNANNFSNDISHKRGAISMARTGNQYSGFDTAGGQFFIVHQDSTFLDGQYAAFGMVIAGMQCVDEIAAAATDAGDFPTKEFRIQSVTADTFGETYAQPEKVSK